jgi:hypothetical protein
MTDITHSALNFTGIRLEASELKPVPMPAFSSRWATLMLAAPWANFVAVSLYVQTASLPQNSAWAVMAIAFMAALGGGISYNRWIAATVDKAAAFAKSRPGYDLALDESGFRWATPNGNMRVDWGEVTTVGEDDRRFYFAGGPRSSVVLPKRVLTELEIGRVRDIIARKAPRARRA